MILGITSIPLMYCCYIGAPLAVVGLVLGIIGRREVANDANPGRNKTFATAGIVTSAVALVLMVFMLIRLFMVLQ